MNYRTKEYFGKELKIDIDSWKQPIKSNKKYIAKIWDKQKRYEILSKSDWEIKEYYDLSQTIYKQGLNNWVNYGIRLGFYKNKKDIIPIIKKMIKIFEKRQDKWKINYWKKELKYYKV